MKKMYTIVVPPQEMERKNGDYGQRTDRKSEESV